VDLGDFVDEALEQALSERPELATMPFTVLDLSRGADQSIVVDRLETRWPRLMDRAQDFRQLSNPADRLWLPVLLPHWVVSEPNPFLYIVDSHAELEENSMWFRRRHQVVTEELVASNHYASIIAYAQSSVWPGILPREL
jgi:hypothetical protein